ncbi:MAG: UvrD-helicase domain-containing protein [Prolixibacteraceae bacterium]|nr:UvrD-helicase domain-containing protein [Prolixibacteraceae bacterium]
MSNFITYKASAGSGKTFRLVVEYLKLILQNDKNYRHILAVTFTNKATAEMKERVIGQLKLLADDAPSDYREIIENEMGLSSEVIRKKSCKALENILFDYDRFSISTIDKFTQRIIKAFNREIGISPNYQLELESRTIINEAVDRLIENVAANSELRNWLESFVEERIDDNQNFDIEKDLLKLGEELFRENVQSNLLGLNAFFEDKAAGREYLDSLTKIIVLFEATLKKQASEMMQLIVLQGFEISDFSYGKAGVVGFIDKTARGIVPEQIGSRVRDALETEEKWASKTNKRRNEILPFVSSEMISRLQRMTAFYEEKSREYYTAKAIKKDWYTMAVLMDMNNEVMALNREKGILPMASSNYLLKSIIDGNEAPFVYEKTGVSFHHFMLDEFQDTSEMQWNNFRPLIFNSMAQGHSNLVVGDVKQSIYRWRNSSWNILAHGVFEDFQAFDVHALTLGSNYRSDENIVAFNNSFFSAFTQQTAAASDFGTFDEQHKTVAETIYSDVEQKNAKQNGWGYVKISMLDSDEENSYKERSLELLDRQIQSLLENGFAPADIAILIRSKANGDAVMRYFLDARNAENRKHDFRILSSESLFLKSSPAVCFTVKLIEYFSDEKSRLTKAVLLQLYRDAANIVQTNDNNMNAAAGQLLLGFEEDFDALFADKTAMLKPHFLTSAIDEMIIRICKVFGFFDIPSEIPFIQSLIDKTAELGKNMPLNISDFLKWWDEKGHEQSVQIGEEADAVRLLTIHKSKGLEFRAVLIPFFDWKLAETKDNILWCIPDEAPFDCVPLTPVSMNKNLAKTIFAGDYYEEMFNSVVDNLNLVYVAFTRARSVLMVNAPAKNNRNQIGFSLAGTLTQLAAQPAFATAWNEEERIFETGQMPVFDFAKPVQHACFEKWRFNDFSSKLRIRAKSDDFVQHTAQGRSGKNMGKIIHEILAQIETVDQIGGILENAMLRLAILPSEAETVGNQIRNILNQPLAAEWFSGKYKILNEQEILTPGCIYRPDRIMTEGDTAIVVDFKTGRRHNAAYQKQMERYKQVLHEMGFHMCEGYIWYLQTNEVEKVGAV